MAEEIYDHYKKEFEIHGDTAKGVNWKDEQSMIKRYRIMIDVISDKTKKCELLDFGCGTAGLYQFIQSHDILIQYEGLDVLTCMIDSCEKKFPQIQFYNYDIVANCDQYNKLKIYDYIICNGVFTVKKNISNDDMFDYMSKILILLWNKCNIGLAFNIMTPLSDFFDDKLFYLSIDKLMIFLRENLSKNIIIRHDYKLYEYTCYVYK